MPDPEAVAMQLLATYEQDYGYDGVPPIPVDDIAGSLALLHIEEATDLRTVPGAPADRGRLSGLLLTEPMTIYVDKSEAARSSGRRRFTIAHELGHWYLHANAEPGSFERYCRDADLETATHQEGEANAFAAALLTPAALLRDQAAACGLNLPLLAQRFDVSLPAMRLRLLTLDLLPAWMR
jgi:hypothetical protein